MSAASAPGGPDMVGRSERPRTSVVVAVAVLALAVGVLTVLEPGAAAALAAAMVLAAALLSTRSLFPPTDLGAKRFRWVSFAWAFLLIQPIGHFTTGRTSLTAAAGVPSVENVADLAINGTIAALALWSIKRNRLTPRPSLLLLSLPVLALLSAAWSLTPNVTLGFSFELVATALLATLTAAICSADPSQARFLVRHVLRLVVLGVALLCVLGLIFRGSWTTQTTTHGQISRFTWPGGHPLWAGAEVGVALLVIVFAGRRDAGFSWPVRIALLPLFGVCLYLAQARTAFAGLAVAGLFGYWFISKGSGPVRRVAGVGAIAGVVLVLASSFGGPLAKYWDRGQSQQQVSSFNGRLGVWTTALQQFHAPGRWLLGYGLGSSRLLFESSPWAADAHSAWLELLLGLGLVGVALAAALIAMLATRLFRGPPDGVPSRVLPIVFVYCLAMSPLGTGYAIPGPEPGLGFALLGLCYAATATRERAVSRTMVGRGPELQRDLRPAPI